MTEELELKYIREFNSGDESAFNIIVKEYHQKIYWHARRMVGNHMDADEITQEVLIIIYKKLKNFNFKSSLYTWIYRITHNKSITQLNKKKIKKLFYFDEPDFETLVNNEDLVSNLESKEKLFKLNGILKQLPVKQREVFVLRNFDELSYEEISEITGKSIGGLKANYFHALKKVMELMKNED
jgi:RNA polymerase sigma-70 factor, ECF subfamily